VNYILPLMLVAACAARPTGPTIRGADLYAHVDELRASGRATVGRVEVRRGQYLVDRSRQQVFVVDQVIAGCDGSPGADCTLALLTTQQFTVQSQAPRGRDTGDDDGDMSGLDKARLVMLLAGGAMVAGAIKCDAFDGCKELMAIGAVTDGLLLLVSYTGMH
jgi:hypothetical protein